VSENFPSIFVMGLNYETAPLAIREKVAFSSIEAIAAAREFKSATQIEDLLILSTCNRTELYFYSESEKDVARWLTDYFGLLEEDILPHLYIHKGADAVHHAARVASGLDSMVLGETQILGQLKDAYRRSREATFLGPVLDKVFQIVFRIAKKVRAETQVGAHSVSLASAALRAGARIFDDLSEQRVLFIGAGEMIRLCAEHFSVPKFKSMTFTNRTKVNADTLARQFGGVAMELEFLSESICEFDIIVSCTASPIPILGKGSVEVALKKRKHKPVVIFDLAVPRDIEEGVSKLEDVFLFSIDDLGELVKTGVSVRKNAIDKAIEIIDKGVEDYRNWASTRSAMPVIKAFRSHGEEIMQDQLRQALSLLRSGADPELVINQLATSLSNRFLDRPCRLLNKTEHVEKEQLAQALSRLFFLDNPK
jgi:glutamyl-tRNA reductase